MTALATHLKNKMKQKEVSAYALEKKAGLKASAVHNILSGRSKNPSIATLQAIAQALECTVSELIMEETETLSEVKESDNIPKKGQPWDADLYLQCFETVLKILKNEQLNLDKQQIMAIVEEVYYYSLGHNKNKTVEAYFAQWLISRSAKGQT